ncbi:MAG: chitin binding domain-containing protein [Desmonostoc geniculatum HA4340-LM1]|jgi:hypothetical protein|nr:chitin binding domain-containing protein [Desmonostoc geniculatum HA4340-LM1]
MKKFFLLVISAFLVIVAVSGLLLNKTQAQSTPQSCPVSGRSLSRLEGSCNLYVFCDQGTAFLKRCPDGLFFNANLEACDWPENTGCIENPDD